MSKPKSAAAKNQPPAPPDALGDAGTAMWGRLACWTNADGHLIELSPVELELLERAARTADLVARLEAEVDAAPVMVKGSKSEIVNPALVELRHQKTALAALLARIDWPTGSDWDEMTASQRARKAARARWSA